jgi:molecular chaperone DnaK
MRIGIELATPHSFACVKGPVHFVNGYPTANRSYITECDATIIPTIQGAYGYRSVLWADPRHGEVLVGYEALERAVEFALETGVIELPLGFSMGCIGTNRTTMMHSRAFTVRDIATCILRHLKASAEAALGEPITKANVTCPAYFTSEQQVELLGAAKDAGLDISELQLLLDPVAASISYMRSHRHEQGRHILVYDLNSVSFDVAILESTGGMIKVRAIDGDSWLGSDFDQRLREWLMAKLEAAGLAIPEINQCDHSESTSRLKYAVWFLIGELLEFIKIQLSEPKCGADFIEACPGQKLLQLFRQLGIWDFSIANELKLNEMQYVELVRHEIERTIDCCRRALIKARVHAHELDTILLIGGSSCGRWIETAMHAEFAVHTERHFPAFSKAIGAAIVAS